MDSIKLDILTPRGPKREGLEVPGVEIPSVGGELGLLPHHEALVTGLVPGVVRFREGNADVRIAVGSGFVEVKTAGRVVILVEQAKEAKNIDGDAVKERLAEVTGELARYVGATTDEKARNLRLEQAWLEAQARVAGVSASAH